MSFTGFEAGDYAFTDDADVERIRDLSSPFLNRYGIHMETGTAVFLPTAKTHSIHAHIDNLMRGDEDAEDAFHQHYAGSINKIGGGLSKLVDKSGTAYDSIYQQKYSRLANSSYDYFNSSGDSNAVHKGLEKYEHLGLKEFKVDASLSTTDNLVLHNAATGETHISFRGTTDDLSRTKQLVKDWSVNSKIAFDPESAENTKRFMDAERQTESVIRKYGKKFLTVSGHSQGGGVSTHIGQKFDITGFHYNPAISLKQVRDNAKGLFAKNMAKQTVYKTHMDFASPLAYTESIQKNMSVNLIGTKTGVKEDIVGTHSLDHFVGDSLKVERNSMVSSMKKSLGTGLGVATQGYFLGQDIKKDLKSDSKGTDITVDVAKNAVQFAGDEVIMGTGIALAPETMGLSVIAGVGASIIFNMGTDIASGVAKKEVKHVAHGIKRDAEVVGRFFKHLF